MMLYTRSVERAGGEYPQIERSRAGSIPGEPPRGATSVAQSPLPHLLPPYPTTPTPSPHLFLIFLICGQTANFHSLVSFFNHLSALSITCPCFFFLHGSQLQEVLGTGTLGKGRLTTKLAWLLAVYLDFYSLQTYFIYCRQRRPT